MNETANPTEPIKTSPRRLGMRRFSTVELLIALALLFFFFPFVEEIKGGDIIVSLLLSLVLLSAVFAVASRRSTLIIALLLAIPAIVGRWINHFRPELVPPTIFLVAGLVLVAFVVVNLLRFVLRAHSVNVEVLCASISAYLMLGLIWTIAYWLVDQIVPNAFAFNTTTGTKESMEGFNAFYFSFITLSTVGYGDITPVSKVARMLAATEAMTGLLYVAVLIARLVALYSSPKPDDS
ncbi:MAG: two pore domain potassium channel family protein [Verrucomicrobia bacterium]|nr:MAG: two pore domain potassium channel family protein [Verrucomicrobiota bacterium]